MIFSEFLSMLEHIKKNGQGYTARCPSHADAKNSLSVTEKSDKIILNCHAGCTVNQICAALNLKLSDLFFEKNGGGSRSQSQKASELNVIQSGCSKKEIAAVYDYRDESGNSLYQNVRFDPKDFRPRHYVGGREIWNLNGIRRVPYRLPELIAAFRENASTIIFLTEGEKDCDNLRRLNLTASSFKSWKPEFARYIEGAHVVILADHDRAGLKQAKAAAELISGKTKSLKLIDLFESEPLPDKHGKDVSDWLNSGNGRSELEKIIADTPYYQSGEIETTNLAATVKNSLIPLQATRFSDIEALPVRWLWKPFLALGTFNLLEGEEGIGKTFLICALASAIGAGRGLPLTPDDEHIESSNVILISAEDSLSHVLKPRLESMNAPVDKIIAVEEPFSLDAEGIFRLSLTLSEYAPKFVVIDPLFSYTGRMNLDRDNDIRAVTDALKRLAEKHDCCIVGIRHIGKSKGFGDSRNAGLNGVGWRASARSALLIGKNPENEHQKALCQTKNNLSPRFEKSLGFEIRGDSQFYWTGESSLTAELMLSAIRNETGEERAERNEAIAFLRDTLFDGARAAKDIKREANTLGLTEQNLRTARRKLGVIVFKEGGNFGGNQHWLWKLPDGVSDAEDVTNETEGVTNNPEDVSKYDNQHLQSNGSNKTLYSNDLAEDVSSCLNPHLQSRNQHLQPPTCSNCSLTLEFCKDENRYFCAMGCKYVPPDASALDSPIPRLNA